MSNENVEARIAKVEVTQRFHEQVINETKADVKETKIDVKDIKEGVNKIQTSLTVLESAFIKQQDQEPRIRALEDQKNQVWGGWKMFLLSCGVVGLLIKEMAIPIFTFLIGSH